MNTIVLPFPYCEMYEDAAKVFATYEADDTLYFGLAPWLPIDVQDMKSRGKGRLIAYQSEPLLEDNYFFKNQTYFNILKQFDEVWDYSEHNLPYLRQMGIGNVKYVPVLPSAVLKEAPLERDIDILHVGQLSFHRRLYLNDLISMGYEVYDVVMQHRKSVYRDEMHQLHRRSRVVLGLHNSLSNHIQESFRYQYSLSNGIAVLAEKSLSNPLGLQEFSNIDELLALLPKHVQPRRHDSNWSLDNYIFALNEDDIDSIGTMPAAMSMEFLECMVADAGAMKQLRLAGRRVKVTQGVNVYLFMEVLYMVKATLLNKQGFDSAQRKAMYIKLKEVYSALEKRPLRRLLLQTGGSLWPRLRCAMQLSGWPVLYATMWLFVKCRAIDKYITRSAPLPRMEDLLDKG